MRSVLCRYSVIAPTVWPCTTHVLRTVYECFSHYFNIHICAESPAKTSPSMVQSSGCAKCGTSKKSGKRSCCARGGAWFRNCGDGSDARFDHTWTDGIEACTSMLSKDPGFPPYIVLAMSSKLVIFAAYHAQYRFTTTTW